jgi:Lipid A 3-O-deacylase (PagL)
LQPVHAQQLPAAADKPSPAATNLISDASFPETALNNSSTEPLVAAPLESSSTDGQVVREVTQGKPESEEKMQQELILEALYSYGNYKIFASGYDMKLFDAGLEYDRHSWGYFLRARADYVAEFLPFVLLDKPLNEDIFGNPLPYRNGKYTRQLVPGIGFSPIGFRLQWRSKHAIKPYLEAKGGLLLFDKKVPSSESSYVNFSLQSATGVQVRMNERWGLRLGLFSDFHFSDAFIVPVNPGLDVMNANLGLSYHF